MRCMKPAIITLALVAATIGVGAQGADQPTNNSPNPYRTIANYFKLPDGREWGSTSAVEIDKDGRSIWVAERCGSNSCAGSNLPSILKFDPSGKLVKSFGAGLLLLTLNRPEVANAMKHRHADVVRVLARAGR